MNASTPSLPSDTAAPMAPPVTLALCSHFGSVATWRDAFVALARAHAGESGRVELAFVPALALLLNRWVASDAGSGDIAGSTLTSRAPSPASQMQH